MSEGLHQVSNGIEKRLTEMVRRGRSVSSYLDRVVWPAYQQAQIVRWQTENTSEGAQWDPLSQPYGTRKKIKYASYPGSGNALMVATGNLAKGAQGEDQTYFGRLIDDHKITVGINLAAIPYASYPGVRRPFMSFSDATIKGWTDGVASYIMKGHK